MKKEETLTRWKALKPDQPIMPHMDTIPYKSEGSSYGACGIRIDGNPAFIDAVLSHLQEVIQGDNGETRLELARQQVDGSKLGKRFNKALPAAEVCYIRLHERGSEAQMLNAFMEAAKERQQARRERAQQAQARQDIRQELCLAGLN